jgi:hypothetical protein
MTFLGAPPRREVVVCLLIEPSHSLAASSWRMQPSQRLADARLRMK